MGHQDQEATGLRSTRVSVEKNTAVDHDISPIVEPKSYNICTMLVPTKKN